MSATYKQWTYICKYCGVNLGTYSGTSSAPQVLSVCDKRECRDQASLAYKGCES